MLQAANAERCGDLIALTQDLASAVWVSLSTPDGRPISMPIRFRGWRPTGRRDKTWPKLADPERWWHSQKIRKAPVRLLWGAWWPHILAI